MHDYVFIYMKIYSAIKMLPFIINIMDIYIYKKHTTENSYRSDSETAYLQDNYVNYRVTQLEPNIQLLRKKH